MSDQQNKTSRKCKQTAKNIPVIRATPREEGRTTEYDRTIRENTDRSISSITTSPKNQREKKKKKKKVKDKRIQNNSKANKKEKQHRIVESQDTHKMRRRILLIRMIQNGRKRSEGTNKGPKEIRIVEDVSQDTSDNQQVRRKKKKRTKKKKKKKKKKQNIEQ
jgi:hypothetical protein